MKRIKIPEYSGDFLSFLGCSFVLPDVENLEHLECNQLKQVADILFHTINYLKESINGPIRSITMNNASAALKGLFKERLELLVRLECIFDDCLTRIPNHEFPQAYFREYSKTKQLHELKNVPTTKNASSSQQPSSTEKRNRSKFVKENNIHFRETDLLGLLKIIPYSRFLARNNSMIIDDSLLVYILREIVRGLRITLLGQTELTDFDMREVKGKKALLKETKKDLHIISICFFTMRTTIKSLGVSKKCDETHRDLIMCYSYFLEFYFVVLSAFSDQTFEIKDSINRMLYPLILRSSAEIRFKLTEFFYDCLQYCSLLSQGVLVYRIVDLILQYDKKIDLDAKDIMLEMRDEVGHKWTIRYNQNKHRADLKSKLCSNLLRHRWVTPKFLPDSEIQSNQDTRFILKKSFEEMEVAQLHNLVMKVWKEFINLKTEKDHLSSLPIINYTNFHILFANVCVALRENLKAEILFILKRNTETMKLEEICRHKVEKYWNFTYLILWKHTTDILFHLVYIVQSADDKLKNTLMCIFMENITHVLQTFITQGIPIFHVTFTENTKTILYILKGMQLSTGYIYLLSCHSKKTYNPFVVAHISRFNYDLDQFIDRVKEFLISHNCQKVFILGNLKVKKYNSSTHVSHPFSQDNEQDGDEELLSPQFNDDGHKDADNSNLLLLNMFLFQMMVPHSKC